MVKRTLMQNNVNSNSGNTYFIQLQFTYPRLVSRSHFRNITEDKSRFYLPFNCVMDKNVIYRYIEPCNILDSTMKAI